MQSTVIPTTIQSVCPSICLSVRPSVRPSVRHTLVPYPDDEGKIMRSSLWGIKNTIVFWYQQWLRATSPYT